VLNIIVQSTAELRLSFMAGCSSMISGFQ